MLFCTHVFNILFALWSCMSYAELAGSLLKCAVMSRHAVSTTLEPNLPTPMTLPASSVSLESTLEPASAQASTLQESPCSDLQAAIFTQADCPANMPMPFSIDRRFQTAQPALCASGSSANSSHEEQPADSLCASHPTLLKETTRAPSGMGSDDAPERQTQTNNLPSSRPSKATPCKIHSNGIGLQSNR